jgi:glucose dehydrogenase
MAGRDRFARIAATGLFMRTPNDAQPQKTNGVENNFLDVRIWLLFFALLISAGVVGYAIARSTKPAAPSVTNATPAASPAASAVPWTLPNGDLLNARVTQQTSISAATVSKLAVAWTMPLTASSIYGTFAANPVTSPDGTA